VCLHSTTAPALSELSTSSFFSLFREDTGAIVCSEAVVWDRRGFGREVLCDLRR